MLCNPRELATLHSSNALEVTLKIQYLAMQDKHLLVTLNRAEVDIINKAFAQIDTMLTSIGMSPNGVPRAIPNNEPLV